MHMESLYAYRACRTSRIWGGTRARGATRMTDSLSVVVGEEEWLDLADAAPRLGFDTATLLRHLQAGGLPVMQLRGEKRTAHRIPRDFVDQARRIVFGGGQVE